MYRSSLHRLSWISLSRLLVPLILINRLSSSVVWLTWTEIRLVLRRVVRLAWWISLSVRWWLTILTIWTSRDWLVSRRWIVYYYAYLIFIFIWRLLNNSRLINDNDSSLPLHSDATPNYTDTGDARAKDISSENSTDNSSSSSVSPSWYTLITRRTITNPLVCICCWGDKFFTATIWLTIWIKVTWCTSREVT